MRSRPRKKRRAKPEAEQGAQEEEEEEVAKKEIEKFTSSSSIPCIRGNEGCLTRIPRLLLLLLWRRDLDAVHGGAGGDLPKINPVLPTCEDWAGYGFSDLGKGEAAAADLVMVCTLAGSPAAAAAVAS